MDPVTLFNDGLTIPRHENNDLHYIGEALPNPSLVVSAVDESTPSFIGASPIPAREDHVHSFGGINLTNYYTKSEIDTMLDEIVAGSFDLTNYYTKAEIDSFNLTLSNAIDALDTRVSTNESDISNLQLIATDHENRIEILEVGTVVVQWVELPWSYGTTVAPTAATVLGRYDAFKEFKITEILVTLVDAATINYVIQLYHQINNTGGYFLENTVTIAAGSVSQTLVLTSPLDIGVNDQLQVVLQTAPTGDGKILTVIIRGFYV